MSETYSTAVAPNGDTITTRPATASDIPEIVRVEELSFSVPWSEDSIRHDIEDNDLAIVTIAEIDGVFAGYSDVWNIVGEGQLNNIAVMPEARGKGVGEAIMCAMIERLREARATEVSLEVRRSNAPAIGLYEKLGFTLAGVRPEYYEDNNEDALILKKEI